MLAQWRETCDQRLAVELGVAVLAAERAQPADLDALDEVAQALEGALQDFTAYRQQLEKYVFNGKKYLHLSMSLRNANNFP